METFPTNAENEGMSPAGPFGDLGAVLLAAGFSRRMGAENKLLKPLRGRPLIAYAAATLAGLGLREVIAVTGHDAREISASLPAKVRTVENAHAAAGMGRSIATGAAALSLDLAGAFIVLGDMPFVAAADYRALAEAFAQAGDEAAICVPVRDGRRGQPVLFGRALFPALSRLDGDRGARPILSAPDANIIEVAGCSSGILADLDDADAFAEAERAMRPDNLS